MPDPLDAPASQVDESASADGLLSEMAGREIDRLLCESEVESDVRPRPERRKAASDPAPPPAAVEPAASEDEGDLAAALDGIFADAPEEPAAVPLPAPESVDTESPAGPPLALRPLIWLNAPLDILPSALRDALGKIALVTLLNAVAVILYVLLFR